jgi:hypothetical protein
LQHTFRLAALAAALLLSACATVTPLSRSQLAALSRDTPAAEVEAAIGKGTARHSFEMQHDGRALAVRVFDLVVGSRTQMMTICTPNCMFIPTQVPVNTTFVLVQNADTARALVAWGTLEELAKDSDGRISTMAAPIRDRVAALEKAR